MTEIRNYDQRYEAELIDLWNRCCTFDPVEVHKFRRQVLFDENFNQITATVKTLSGNTLTDSANKTYTRLTAR